MSDAQQMTGAELKAKGEWDMTNEHEQITGPAHWAPYLINGDISGLTDEDIEAINLWLEREGVAEVLSCGDEAYFTWHMKLHCPELGCNGGSVLDYTVSLI